jgi:hypothetical protein
MLHNLVKETIVFATENNIPYKYTELEDKDIHTCISQIDEKCGVKGSICRITNNKCQLVLPKMNLINDTDNELYYYGRMADELIRYNRIKSLIFKPQSYLSFGQIKYNLRDDEIIILQDLLNQEFFENLIPADINKFARYNTYDTAEPLITQTYKKDIELDEAINPYHVRDCAKSEPKQIKSLYWKKCFPNNYKEIDYSGSNYCSLYLIIDLVAEFTNKTLNIEDVKEDLIEAYSNLTDNFTNQNRINKIIDVLREEAQFDANQLQDNTIKFDQMIYHDGFVAVNFDLWLLLVKYKIPSVFISSKLIPETRYNLSEFVCYTNMDDKEFAIIITPAMYKRSDNKFPEYKIVVNNKNNAKINLDDIKKEDSESINDCLTKIEHAIIDYITIEDYLDLVYEKDVTTKYKPKKKGIREIQFEEITAPIADNENFEIIPKKQPKKIKGKKIQPTLVLEEAEEAIEQPSQKIEDMIFNQEVMEITPVKRKTKKQREKKMVVNPPGKNVTRKKKQIDFEINDADVEIF